MKKIGLALCYNTKNFGSQLQVLATIKKIESLGFTTEIIQYQKKMTPKFALRSAPRFLNSYFVKGKLRTAKKNKDIKTHPNVAEKVAIRDQRFNDFVNQYFTNMSMPYNGWENLVRNANNVYDAYLCGSDQLWLPANLGSHFYTLEFVSDEKPKVAYATSFGVSTIPYYQKNRTARYLNRFQSLSTREVSGKKIVEELTGRNVKVVCDPTMLFDSEEWLDIIPDKRVISEPYVFAYFLGTNIDHRYVAEMLVKQTGMKLVTCPFLDNFVEYDLHFGDIQLFDMDSADFVNLIRHAEYILTDSFHGSVFSILNHKSFLIFDRFKGGTNSRNSRIDSLCSAFGLEERRYRGNVCEVKKAIDYDDVDFRLQSFRKDSMDYLNQALSEVYC